MGPMPGIIAKRWLTGLLLSQAIGCFSRTVTAASICSICVASTCSTWRARPGRRASSSSRMIAISLPTLRRPCGAITPNSARCARRAFTSIVRWRTSRSRPRCSSTAACCSAVLTGTKRIVGRHNRLADRFRIRSVVLVPLDVGLHVLRRHQPHLVAQRAATPAPSSAPSHTPPSPPDSAVVG